MTAQELDELLEYSTSIPSGTYIGKLWKRNNNALVRDAKGHNVPPEWTMGEYIPDPQAKIGKDGKPDTIGIKWRKIEIVVWP